MALEKVAAPDTLDPIIKLFSALSGSSMFGSGTTTTSSSSSPESNAQADELLKTIMGDKSNPALNDMITNIMERAKQSFAPVLGQGITAGNRAYSDTTVKQLAGEAIARASGEAAQAKLNFINSSNATAAQIVDTKLQANRTTTAKTTATPMGNATSALGAGLGAYSLYKKLKGDKASTAKSAYDFAQSAGSEVNPFNLNGPTDPIFNVTNDFGSNLSEFASSPEFNPFAVSDFTSSINPSFGGFAGSEGFAEGGSALEFAEGGGGLAEVFGGSGFLTGAEGAELAGLGAASSGLEIGAGLGAFEGAGAAAGLAEVGGAAFGLEEAAVAVALWVICTELKSKGELDAQLHAIGYEHFAKLPKETIRGYQWWAIPYTRFIRKRTRFAKFGRSFIRFLARKRVEHIASQRNVLGWMSVAIGEKICWCIGKCLKEDQDWQSLYKLEGEK